jgi:hypothetical protein
VLVRVYLEVHENKDKGQRLEEVSQSHDDDRKRKRDLKQLGVCSRNDRIQKLPGVSRFGE